MLGAIVGDVVGSIHEFRSIPTKTKDFGPLFVDNISVKKVSGFKIYHGGYGHKVSESSHFTDDTVCVLGIAQWLIDNKNANPAPYLRNICQIYPKRGYGGMFSKWVVDNSMGPYNSWGNGAPMRVSPVGWAASSLDEAYTLAKRSAEITHNHPNAIKGAQVVAGMIYLIKNNNSLSDSLEQVISDLDKNKYYQSILKQSLNEIRPNYTYKVSSKNTVPQALLCLKEASDFEDSIRNAISLGGRC